MQYMVQELRKSTDLAALQFSGSEYISGTDHPDYRSVSYSKKNRHEDKLDTQANKQSNRKKTVTENSKKV